MIELKWYKEMKNTLKNSSIVLAICTLAAFCTVSVATPALAACQSNEQEVSLPVDQGGTKCIPKNADSTDISDNPIFFYLKNVLIFLGGGIGLAVVGGIIYGAFLYITARANVAQTEKGQEVIINSVIALVLFIFMYAILQFVIPGGIFQ